MRLRIKRRLITPKEKARKLRERALKKRFGSVEGVREEVVVGYQENEILRAEMEGRQK